jgi:MFS family permease
MPCKPATPRRCVARERMLMWIPKSGAVVSIFTGGAFFGAMFAGITGDYLGRKKTILIGAVIFCLGGALQTGAQTINYLYSGRCLAGVGYVDMANKMGTEKANDKSALVS